MQEVCNKQLPACSVQDGGSMNTGAEASSKKSCCPCFLALVVYFCFSLTVKVTENNLLPLLMEEFPHLHISRPAMNKMWRQQLAQIELLKDSSDKSHLKLQSEVSCMSTVRAKCNICGKEIS